MLSKWATIAVALLSQGSLAINNRWCASLTKAISSANFQSEATSFCSSYLSITTHSTTVTSTSTSIVTSTTTKTDTVNNTPTSTAHITTTTTTTSGTTTVPTTSTSTVSSPDPNFTCFTGGTQRKRKRSNGRPPPWRNIPQASFSSACSCFSLATPTTTIVHKTTATSTEFSTMTVTVTNAGAAETTTITSTITSTVPSATSISTVTATTTTLLGSNAQFYIKDQGASGNDATYAALIASGNHNVVFFSGAEGAYPPQPCNLDDNCYLLIDGSYVGVASDGQVQSGFASGQVDCNINIVSDTITCHAPSGGSGTSICPTGGDDIEELYLSSSTPSRCFPVNLSVQFIGVST